MTWFALVMTIARLPAWLTLARSAIFTAGMNRSGDAFTGDVSDNESKVPSLHFYESYKSPSTTLAGYVRAAMSNPGTLGGCCSSKRRWTFAANFTSLANSSACACTSATSAMHCALRRLTKRTTDVKPSGPSNSACRAASQCVRVSRTSH